MQTNLLWRSLAFVVWAFPASAQAADMLFICHDNQGRAEYLTVSPAEKKVTMISGVAPARCVGTFKNGAMGRIMSAPSGDSCPYLLFGDDTNPSVHQSVVFSGPEVEFGVRRGDAGMDERLNIDTGLLQTPDGFEECHRPHS